MLPLQAPGGPELLVIGFIVLILLAIVGGLIAGIVYFIRHRRDETSSDSQRIEELEQRVAELESIQDSPNKYRETNDDDERGSDR